MPLVESLSVPSFWVELDVQTILCWCYQCAFPHRYRKRGQVCALLELGLPSGKSFHPNHGAEAMARMAESDQHFCLGCYAAVELQGTHKTAWCLVLMKMLCGTLRRMSHSKRCWNGNIQSRKEAIAHSKDIDEHELEHRVHTFRREHQHTNLQDTVVVTCTHTKL
jgi:hypothetical protein